MENWGRAVGKKGLRRGKVHSHEADYISPASTSPDSVHGALEKHRGYRMAPLREHAKPTRRGSRK